MRHHSARHIVVDQDAQQTSLGVKSSSLPAACFGDCDELTGRPCLAVAKSHNRHAVRVPVAASLHGSPKKSLQPFPPFSPPAVEHTSSTTPTTPSTVPSSSRTGTWVLVVVHLAQRIDRRQSTITLSGLVIIMTDTNVGDKPFASKRPTMPISTLRFLSSNTSTPLRALLIS